MSTFKDQRRDAYAAKQRAEARIMGEAAEDKEIALNRLARAAGSKRFAPAGVTWKGVPNFDPSKMVALREQVAAEEDAALSGLNQRYRGALGRIAAAERAEREAAERQRAWINQQANSPEIGDVLRRYTRPWEAPPSDPAMTHMGRPSRPVAMGPEMPTEEWREWDANRREKLDAALRTSPDSPTSFIPAHLRSWWADLGEPKQFESDPGGPFTEAEVAKMGLGYAPMLPLLPAVMQASTVPGVALAEAAVNLPHALMSGDWGDYAQNVALATGVQKGLGKVLGHSAPTGLFDTAASDALGMAERAAEGANRAAFSRKFMPFETATTGSGLESYRMYSPSSHKTFLNDEIARNSMRGEVLDTPYLARGQGAWVNRHGHMEANPLYVGELPRGADMVDAEAMARRLNTRANQDAVAPYEQWLPLFDRNANSAMFEGLPREDVVRLSREFGNDNIIRHNPILGTTSISPFEGQLPAEVREAAERLIGQSSRPVSVEGPYVTGRARGRREQAMTRAGQVPGYPADDLLPPTPARYLPALDE